MEGKAREGKGNLHQAGGWSQPGGLVVVLSFSRVARCCARDSRKHGMNTARHARCKTRKRGAQRPSTGVFRAHVVAVSWQPVASTSQTHGVADSSVRSRTTVTTTSRKNTNGSSVFVCMFAVSCRVMCSCSIFFASSPGRHKGATFVPPCPDVLVHRVARSPSASCIALRRFVAPPPLLFFFG